MVPSDRSLNSFPTGKGPALRLEKHFQPWEVLPGPLLLEKCHWEHRCSLGGVAGLSWGRWGRRLEAWQRECKSAS